jgi:hypothetical protein
MFDSLPGPGQSAMRSVPVFVRHDCSMNPYVHLEIGVIGVRRAVEEAAEQTCCDC